MVKKRILLVAYDGMNKSGVPGVIMEIINGLHEDFDFSLAVFENIENDYYFNRLKELDIPVYVIPKKNCKNSFSKLYYEIKGYHHYLEKEFSKIFKENKFDAVHSFKESDSSGIFSIAKKFGVEKRILHTTVLHNSTDFWGKISKKKLKRTNKFTNVRVGGSKLSCELAYEKKEFIVIPNCYKSDYYKFIEAGPFEKLEIAQVGYYSPNKNQIFSLNVVNCLKEHFPNAVLHLFGNNNDKAYYDQLLREIDRLEMKDNVIIHDGNDDQMEVFKKTSFVFVPSIREGFSLTLLEAQACGIRCLASTGVPNDANAGGVTFVELNAKKWADEVENDFSKNHGKHVRYDMEKFSREQFCKNIKKLYLD